MHKQSKLPKVVTQHIWRSYIEQAEDIRHTPLGKRTYEQRKETIERVFADAKEKHGMRYTPHRGLTAVTNWVTLKFAAMNLKSMPSTGGGMGYSLCWSTFCTAYLAFCMLRTRHSADQCRVL